MPLLPRRRDPYWDVDGAAAQKRRHREGVVAALAFAAAFAALVAALIAWAGVMGMAPVGIPTIQIAAPAGDLGDRSSMASTGLVSVLLFAVVASAAAVAGRVLRPRDL